MNKGLQQTEGFLDRETYTSQRFKRIRMYESERQNRTSQAPRAFPHQMKNKTLNANKENIEYSGYLSKVQSAAKIDEKAQISKYLWSLRKQYDKLSKNIKQRQFAVTRMQKQIEQMRQKSQNQVSQFFEAKGCVQGKAHEFQQFIFKQQEARMDRKILQNIISRMKTDGLWRKCETRNLETKVKDKQKALKNTQDTSIQWDQGIHRMSQKLMQIQKQFDHNNSERRLKYEEYQNKISDIQDKEKFQFERKQRTYELLKMESNDVLDAKNLVIRDALLANRMFGYLLENKIAELLRNHKKTEDSYHRIKNQTSIDDPQQLCFKFLSYSEVLQDITTKINLFQKKLDDLTKQNKRLKTQQNQKKIKMLEEQRIRNNEKDQILIQQEKLRLKGIEKQLEIKKIKDWINKMGKSLGLETTKQDEPITKFWDVCQKLLIQAKEIQSANLLQIKYEIDPSNIRPKKCCKDVQDEKNKRNQAMEVIESNVFQSLYLQKQRKQVKKNKFLIKSQSTRSKTQL